MERQSYLSFGKLTDKFTLRELVNLRKEAENKMVWSARLSTGLIGLPNCESGNRGPIKDNEVVLAIGDEGLRFLIELGFITCPSCKPENIPDFWDTVSDLVEKIYGIDNLVDFINKSLIPFDASRLNWELLLPLLGKTPNRLYVPSGLTARDIVVLSRRFEEIGFKLPPVGYYDKDAPGRFSEYSIDSL